MQAVPRALAIAMAAGVLGAQPVSARPPSFAAAMRAILARPPLAHAIVAAEVYDLDAKRPLYAYRANVLMEAASTTKLLTTGTALALLGPGFRWTTPVYRTGPIDADGVLHGDLVLVASGDPNLSQRLRPDGTLAFENEDHSYDGTYDTRAVPGDPLAVLRDLASQVARAGVKGIDGRVLIDALLFASPGPEGGTGAVVSPIVVNDNLVDVTIAPGAARGDPVRVSVSPQTPYVRFVDAATTGAPGTEPAIDFSGDTADAAGSRIVRITGTQPTGAAMLYAYRVPDPQAFARDAFTVALRGAGIAVVAASASTAPAARPSPRFYVPTDLVARHVSLPLSADVVLTLKVSDNLHADLMPYRWALSSGASGGDLLAAAFARERALLRGAGLDLRGAAQQDGLGDAAFFTPDFMVAYLAWARAQRWFPVLLRGLPVLGVDGTLFDVQTGSPARGRVFAKTGTWGSQNLLGDDGLITKGLAGYATTRTGRHVAFAFYLNRMAGKSSVYPAKDAAHYAGRTLGEMAADAYLLL